MQVMLSNRTFVRRLLHTSSPVAIKFFGVENKQKQWETAISAAEKVVGYPTSFMNLRFWLSDEMSNIAINMRKLIGTKHPLMKTAKGLIFDDKENIQTRGLIVLLISKASGYPETPKSFDHHQLDKDFMVYPSTDSLNGILPTQRSLAEITEMIHTAFTLHKGVMNIGSSIQDKPIDPETEDLLYGNKMALLSGDYLLAKASSGLAALRNTYVVEVMASAISDLMESRFLLEDLGETKKSFNKLIWENLAYKSGGCLYAKACQSSLMLSGHHNSQSDIAFEFGKCFGLLRQLKSDYDNAQSNQTYSTSIYNLLSQKDINLLKLDIADKATTCLQKFLQNDANKALQSFIHALASQ